MGGRSSQTETQNSTTNPWAPAQPMLQGILGQLNGQLGNTGLTGAESSALSNISANGGNQFAPQINDLASRLLSGGGANNQAGNISGGLDDYTRRLSGMADGANIGPDGNPALRGYLDTIGNDVSNRINSMFAGAGRDLSGAHTQSIARGISEGTAPVLAAQYNTDVGNMRGAADALYGATNTTGGILSGLNQQDLQNRAMGADVSQVGADAATSGSRAVLEAEAARRVIPAQALGLLAQIGVPIAGLGQQTNGTATRTNQMSGAQQFGLITGGLSSLFGGGRR